MTDDRDLRPDDEMERRMGSWLTDTDLTPGQAAAGLDRLLDEFPVTPQARRRFLGRWLDRDEGAGRRASEHDHPPDTTRRTRFMLSATGLTAAFAILALTVNVVNTEPAPPNQAGANHVVAADGSGGYDTIQAAVDAAEPGDTVSVLPGRYNGPIDVASDITLSGDGPREKIVIVAPMGDVDVNTWLDELSRPHALSLGSSSATVSDLTVEVPVGATGIESTGGSPLIERVSIVMVEFGEIGEYDDYYAMGFFGTSSPTIRDSEWDGYTAVRDATVIIEGNTISRDGISIDGPGGSVVRGNTFLDGGSVNTTEATATIADNDFTGGGASFDSGSVVDVRDNTFRDATGADDDEATAIYLDGVDTKALIVNNTVTNALNGIELANGAGADIEGNTLSIDGIGITAGRTGDVTIDGNTIAGEGAGIVLKWGADAGITGNTIDVTGRGIAIGTGASPTVSGNDVCGGMDSIWIADGNDLELGDNEVC